eukprot:6207804-Pleurochrysis_carterae.AAC.1
MPISCWLLEFDLQVLYVNDAYGEGFQKGIVDLCTKSGTAISTFAFSATDEVNLRSQISRLGSTNINVVFAVTLSVSGVAGRYKTLEMRSSLWQIVSSSPAATMLAKPTSSLEGVSLSKTATWQVFSIVNFAFEFNLIGAGTSWIWADGVFIESLRDVDARFKADTHGSLYISQALTSEEDEGWRNFERDWQTFDPDIINTFLPRMWQLPVGVPPRRYANRI